MKCKFTEVIHGKGWTVWNACKHWGIRYDVWRRKCRNVKLDAQLMSMCNGLERKANIKRDEFVDQCNRKMQHIHPDATDEMYETLYDEGARFVGDSNSEHV